jgi:hypothetical protein
MSKATSAGRAQRAPGDVAGAALPGAGRGRRRHAAVPAAQVGSIYQAQSNAVFDAAMRRGRLRFGQGRGLLAPRQRPAAGARHQARHAFFNLPDMDFGLRDAAFVPFFGVPAATLLAPSRMARSAEHGGAAGGGRDPARRPGLARALPPPGPTGPPTTPGRRARMNAWIESEMRAQPGAVPVGAQALQDAAARASRRCTANARIIRRHAAALHQDAGRGQRLRRARRHARAPGAHAGAAAPPGRPPLRRRRRPDPGGRAARDAGVDFRYRIFNGASGDEVEHCGNGARCFVRFVREHGLTDKPRCACRPSTTRARAAHAEPTAA